MATEHVSDLIPFVHVADVRRSIEFYERLGFTVSGTHVHDGALDWAALESGAARLMLARAGPPDAGARRTVLFYLYSPDLADLREHLVAEGIAVGPIRDGTPGPRREMALSDPDGYCLMIAEMEQPESW
jgi:catechol 2,3-dioxygenase-like lactoylglutathione lyase family enzyme